MLSKKDIQKQIEVIIDWCINDYKAFKSMDKTDDEIRKKLKETWNDFSDWIYENRRSKK